MTRLTRSSLIISGVLILGIQSAQTDDTPSQSCNCSCENYALLVSDELPQSPTKEEELLACAGACAIAWVRCEEQDTQLVSDEGKKDTALGTARPVQASAVTNNR
jgi:hypothetical protein